MLLQVRVRDAAGAHADAHEAYQEPACDSLLDAVAGAHFTCTFVPLRKKCTSTKVQKCKCTSTKVQTCASTKVLILTQLGDAVTEFSARDKTSAQGADVRQITDAYAVAKAADVPLLGRLEGQVRY